MHASSLCQTRPCQKLQRLESRCRNLRCWWKPDCPASHGWLHADWCGDRHGKSSIRDPLCAGSFASKINRLIKHGFSVVASCVASSIPGDEAAGRGCEWREVQWRRACCAPHVRPCPHGRWESPKIRGAFYLGPYNNRDPTI